MLDSGSVVVVAAVVVVAKELVPSACCCTRRQHQQHKRKRIDRRVMRWLVIYGRENDVGMETFHYNNGAVIL